MQAIIVAVADGKAAQVVNAIDGLTYQAPPKHPYVHPRLLYQRNEVTINLIVLGLADGVTLPWTSAGNNGTWDLFVLAADPGSIGGQAMADDAGWRWITRAQRKLLRASAAKPSHLRGPWTIPEAIETWPAQAEKLLKDDKGNWSFPLLAGAGHEDAAAWDYRPTQQAINEDIDADPDDLFPEFEFEKPDDPG